MNVVELEYKVLQALEKELKTAQVSRQYGDTIISFLLTGGKQRARVTVSIVDVTLCLGCGEEIVEPRHRQTRHTLDKCQEPSNVENLLESGV